MEYEWDEQKAASNFRKHKLTFDDGVAVFDDPAHVIIEASRERDREVRSKAIGTFKGAVYVVVFTVRGKVRRIISARRANVKEKKAYGHR